MKYGKKVSGRLVPKEATVSTMSKMGEVYELHIDTEAFDDEVFVMRQLLLLEQQFTDFKILYIETHREGGIIMQATDVGPGAWTFSGIFSVIPALLLLGGIIVAMIVLFQVVTTAPSWIWPVIVAGGFLMILAVWVPWKKIPTPTEIRRGTKKTVKEEGTRAALAELDTRRKSLRFLLADYRSDLDRLSRDKAKLNAEATSIRKKKKPSDWEKERLKDIKETVDGINRDTTETKREQREGQLALRAVEKEVAGLKS